MIGTKPPIGAANADMDRDQGAGSEGPIREPAYGSVGGVGARNAKRR